jgi:hypothetical protein
MRNIALAPRELLYERLFSSALPRLQIEHRYFPVGNAANYSLLYLILRIVAELPVQRVLEFGCGQTTLLLDDLSRWRPMEIITIEHEIEWANRIQERVNQKIVSAPLVERTIQDVSCLTYDLSPEDLASPVDLIIVDGPLGTRRQSRWGMLEYLDSQLAQDFIVLFDDAGRKGEQDTIEAALRYFDERGKEVFTAATNSIKSQFLIAAGSLREAAYF